MTLRSYLTSATAPAGASGGEFRHAWQSSPIFELTSVLVRVDHVARFIVNANHGIMRAAGKLCVVDCIGGCADRNATVRIEVNLTDDEIAAILAAAADPKPFLNDDELLALAVAWRRRWRPKTTRQRRREKKSASVITARALSL